MTAKRSQHGHRQQFVEASALQANAALNLNLNGGRKYVPYFRPAPVAGHNGHADDTVGTSLLETLV